MAGKFIQDTHISHIEQRLAVKRSEEKEFCKIGTDSYKIIIKSGCNINLFVEDNIIKPSIYPYYKAVRGNNLQQRKEMNKNIEIVIRDKSNSVTNQRRISYPESQRKNSFSCGKNAHKFNINNLKKCKQIMQPQ
ncbi:hypothetical protein ABPG72_015232 [Tetrahymena utriculariae]